MIEYKNRAEVPEKYRFDLTDFYKNDQEWELNYQKAKQNIQEIKYFQNQKITAKMVEDYLAKSLNLSSELLDLYVYAYLSHDVDLDNPIYIEMKNKISSLFTKYEEETAFFQPLLLTLDRENFEKLFHENKNLEAYRILLEDVYALKTHILSETEEKLISILTDTFDSYENISSSLINSEHNYGKLKVDGKVIEIAANNLRFLKQNKDEKIRKSAYQKFNKTIAQYQNTESNLLNQYVKNHVNLARIRNYSSSWAAKLEAIHISNDVFEALKKAAKNHKKSWQNYFKLVKDNIKVKTLHNYDTLLDWGKSDKTYTIEQTEKLITEALSILGQDYQSHLLKVFNNHYIDYCQYKGKVSGGYSFSTYNHDSRIVLSFNGSFDNVLTIAHEAGHNVHHQYISKNNPVHYRDSSSFIAEVASLTNEFLTNAYITKNGKTKEERLQGIEHTLKTFQNNFFDAIMEAEIEQKMYQYVEEGNVITADYLNSLVKNSKKEYLGNVIKSDSYDCLSWVTRSHYYMHFYLYSYALCVSIAAYVSQKILSEEEGFLEKYKTFLKCGSNMYPEEIYKTLGIDLKDDKVFSNAVEFFDNQIEEYKKVKEGVI